MKWTGFLLFALVPPQHRHSGASHLPVPFVPAKTGFKSRGEAGLREEKSLGERSTRLRGG